MDMNKDWIFFPTFCGKWNELTLNCNILQDFFYLVISMPKMSIYVLHPFVILRLKGKEIAWFTNLGPDK